jgi:hypothetical protein
MNTNNLLSETLDGDEFFDLIDKCYKDPKTWYEPSTEDEMKKMQWISPDEKLKDGIVRCFTTTGFLSEFSKASGIQYYYHVNGGNMTYSQVAEKKSLASKRRRERFTQKAI